MGRKKLVVNLLFQEGREPGVVMVKACREDWEMSKEDRRELGDRMLKQPGMVQLQNGRGMSYRVLFQSSQVKSG